jgi:hypothetical protein
MGRTMEKILENFFINLARDPIALTLLEVGLGSIILGIILMFIHAYLQGREISFWPPKIGKKVKIDKQSKNKTSKEW